MHIILSECQYTSLTAAVPVLLLPHESCLQLATTIAMILYVLASMVEWVVTSTVLSAMPVSSWWAGAWAYRQAGSRHSSQQQQCRQQPGWATSRYGCLACMTITWSGHACSMACMLVRADFFAARMLQWCNESPLLLWQWALRLSALLLSTLLLLLALRTNSDMLLFVPCPYPLRRLSMLRPCPSMHT